MTKTPLPPELGGDVSREEWIAAVKREDSKRFYLDVQKASSNAPAMDRAEQAKVLRHAAEQLERDGRGDPVQRSQDRVKERDAYPNRQFFQKSPAQPSQEMRDRWVEAYKNRQQTVPPKDWNADMKARAQDVRPMEHFRSRDTDRDR